MKNESFNEQLDEMLKNSYKSLVQIDATLAKRDAGLIEVKEDDVVMQMKFKEMEETREKVVAEIELLEKMYK